MSLSVINDQLSLVAIQAKLSIDFAFHGITAVQKY
jgi:hypothetical protein